MHITYIYKVLNLKKSKDVTRDAAKLVVIINWLAILNGGRQFMEAT